MVEVIVKDGDMKPIDPEKLQITGEPNLRWRDNLYQALAVLVGILFGVAIGVRVFEGRQQLGVAIGGVCGTLVGLFISGIYLMILRRSKRNSS